MSSGTSTKTKRKNGGAPVGSGFSRISSPSKGASNAPKRASSRPEGGSHDGGATAADAGLQPVHILILGTVAAASGALLVVHGTRPANIVFIVLAIVAAGTAAMAAYRTLWPLTSEVASIQTEMVGGRTRAALEREKTIVLRAIKELEFDRAMGKVSAADCEEMIGRLRARAVRLIRQLDSGSAGYRDLIEREVNARLVAKGAGSAPTT